MKDDDLHTSYHYIILYTYHFPQRHPWLFFIPRAAARHASSQLQANGGLTKGQPWWYHGLSTKGTAKFLANFQPEIMDDTQISSNIHSTIGDIPLKKSPLHYIELYPYDILIFYPHFRQVAQRSESPPQPRLSSSTSNRSTGGNHLARPS
jgi:hypothetical protein